MTVEELRDKLNLLPGDLDVFMDERVTDFTYGLVNSIEVKEIDFVEEPGGEPLSRDKVLVISEE